MKHNDIIAIIAIVGGCIVTALNVVAFVMGNITIAAQVVPVALVNPGLEGEYTPHDGIGELKVPHSWVPWWSGRRPEYLPFETADLDSEEERSGGLSQKVFTTYSAQDAGIYQIVTGVTPDQWYTFKAWVYSQAENDAGKGSAMVCVNPWGTWGPKGDTLYRTTVCGKERSFGTESWQEPYGQWYQVEVTAQAWSDTITVFMRGVAEHAVRWNDFFWDDAELEPVTIGGTGPTPAPCPTVVPCPTAGAGGECATLVEIEALLRGMNWGVR